jgi:hypothetical protein
LDLVDYIGGFAREDFVADDEARVALAGCDVGSRSGDSKTAEQGEDSNGVGIHLRFRI